MTDWKTSLLLLCFSLSLQGCSASFWRKTAAATSAVEADDPDPVVETWWEEDEHSFPEPWGNRRKPGQKVVQKVPMHPLRSANWTLRVHWLSNDHATRPSLMELEFDPNGFVRTGSRVGTWWTRENGLGLVISLPDDLECFASFHPNIFGKHAKLTRGVILRKSSTSPHRVVGSFRGSSHP